MISNQIEVEISKNAHIEPVFIDYKNDLLVWDKVRQYLQAHCQWRNVNNSTPYGVFTVDNDGRVVFSPHTKGQFKVLCVVFYTDITTREEKTIEQFFTITVTDACECDVKISDKVDNRLVKELDGSLYVPELQIDLVQVYAGSKDEELPPVSTSITSEDILAEFANEVGEDVGTLKKTIAESIVVERLAGSDLPALICVYENNGVVYRIDYRDTVNIDQIVGITISGASFSNKIKVKSSGYIEDDFWQFTPGRVWLGVNGQLTQTAPEDGFDVLIGTAVSPKKLFLNIQDPIEME